jgi:GNAT superfamily N-acetyltransferase
MDAKEMLSRFDRERRQDPSTLGTYEVEKTANLTRLVAASRSLVLWSRINSADIPDVVEDEKSWARSHSRPLVWKLYSHDSQPELSKALADAGLHPKPHETLMLFDLATELPVGPTTPGLRVEQVLDDERFRDYVSIDRGAFRAAPGPPNAPAQKRPVDPRVGLFIAYMDRTPASIGRVEFEPGQALGGLFGGGTSPAFRRRGIYRELVRTRVEWARDRGARGVFTEAVDTTSRPILERLGFVAVAGIESWTWEVAGPTEGAAASDART